MRHLSVRPEEGKRLERELKGYLSYRANPLRIIYRLESRSVFVEAIGERREIYERFTPSQDAASTADAKDATGDEKR
jgi:mRNA-degrading endonuclease RelE of RelBE toxin-antitoxin system